MGDTALDTAAKSFKAPPDKAALYIYRNESFGGAVKMDIELNGQTIGQTGAKTYLYKEVVPGKYTVASKSENTDSIEVDAKPGIAYFIWQEVKMGLMYARTKLHLVDAATGKQGVGESALAVTR